MLNGIESNLAAIKIDLSEIFYQCHLVNGYLIKMVEV